MTEADHKRNQDMEPQLATQEEMEAYVSDLDNRGEYSTDGIMNCGDDRYKNGETRPSLFGATHGITQGLLRYKNQFELNRSTSELIDAVARVVKKYGGIYTAHSDDNEDPNDPASLKCGHAFNATLSKNKDKYGINPDDMIEANTYVKKQAKLHPDTFHIDILTGPHNAIGVFLDEGMEKTLKHTSKGKSFYVVTVNKNRQFINDIFPDLEEELPELKANEITAGQFNDDLWEQTVVTASILAPNFPVAKTNSDDPTPHAEPQDPIPAAA